MSVDSHIQIVYVVSQQFIVIAYYTLIFIRCILHVVYIIRPAGLQRMHAAIDS